MDGFSPMHVLVTGGAGYIGSHACVALLEAGHAVTVLDNLCNSSAVALARVQEIAGKPLTFIHGDIRDPEDLDRALLDGADAGGGAAAGVRAVGCHVGAGWNNGRDGCGCGAGGGGRAGRIGRGELCADASGGTLGAAVRGGA